MPVTLRTLLNAAPFDQEDRDDLLRRYGELDEEQKIRLSITAWTALSQMYFAKLKYETEKIMLEIDQGKRKFNRSDFEEVKTKIIHEFAEKLQVGQSQEQIDEVRQQLEKFKTQPFVQDNASSPPPVQQSSGQAPKN